MLKRWIRLGSLWVVTLGALWALSGCVTAPVQSPTETLCPADPRPTALPTDPHSPNPQPIVNTSLMKAPTMTIASENRLASCVKDGSCDRVHFLQALFSLQGNPEVAASHFRDVVRIAPKSQMAKLSRSWLKAMSTPSALDANQVATETSAWLAELLNRDKKVEDLSKQLNALKLVDLEMKDRTSIMKPQMSTLPSNP